jgi:isopenicillin N synthase-like dioxygenase
MLAPTRTEDTNGHPCIPVISLLSDDVATKWDAAMRTVGFAVITDHGVDPALQERVREASKDWFTGMSDTHKEQRRRFRSPKYGLPGFSPLGAEAVGQTLTPAGPPPSVAGQEGQRASVPSSATANNTIATRGTDGDVAGGVDQSAKGQNGGGMATAPSTDNTKQSSAGGMSDLVESFVMSSETQALPPSLEGPLRAYWTEMTRVLRGVMELSAQALGIDKNYFAPHFSPPSCALRCAHYPALHSLRAADMAGRERYGPHTGRLRTADHRQLSAHCFDVTCHALNPPPSPKYYVFYGVARRQYLLCFASVECINSS